MISAQTLDDADGSTAMLNDRTDEISKLCLSCFYLSSKLWSIALVW